MIETESVDLTVQIELQALLASNISVAACLDNYI